MSRYFWIISPITNSQMHLHFWYQQSTSVKGSFLTRSEEKYNTLVLRKCPKVWKNSMASFMKRTPNRVGGENSCCCMRLSEEFLNKAARSWAKTEVVETWVCPNPKILNSISLKKSNQFKLLFWLTISKEPRWRFRPA